METGVDFIAAVGQAITTVGDVLELFIKPPTVYFTALAFAGAAAGVARKFVPMKKR